MDFPTWTEHHLLFDPRPVKFNLLVHKSIFFSVDSVESVPWSPARSLTQWRSTVCCHLVSEQLLLHNLLAAWMLYTRLRTISSSCLPKSSPRKSERNISVAVVRKLRAPLQKHHWHAITFFWVGLMCIHLPSFCNYSKPGSLNFASRILIQKQERVHEQAPSSANKRQTSFNFKITSEPPSQRASFCSTPMLTRSSSLVQKSYFSFSSSCGKYLVLFQLS